MRLSDRKSARVISIHALVKRATHYLGGDLYLWGISIHALVKRATINQICDYNENAISIHALVKRATKPELSE